MQDDDGTAYIWDMKLRKFVEKGTQAPDYDESQMTFEATEETIPAMPQPSVVRSCSLILVPGRPMPLRMAAALQWSIRGE